MITNNDLLEHFGLIQNEEVLEHYGVPGMRWGVRKARSTSSRIKSRAMKKINAVRENRRRQKEINRQLRKEARIKRKQDKALAKEIRKNRSKYNRQAKKDQRKHVKDLEVLVRDLGKLSDKEVKDLASRLENETKIINNTKKIAESLPPTKAQQLGSALNTIGNLTVPKPVFDKQGNIVDWNPNGKVKNVVQDAVLNYATNYLRANGVATPDLNAVASAIEDVGERVKKSKE